MACMLMLRHLVPSRAPLLRVLLLLLLPLLQRLQLSPPLLPLLGEALWGAVQLLLQDQHGAGCFRYALPPSLLQALETMRTTDFFRICPSAATPSPL